MLFSRLILASLVVALIAGATLSVFQYFWLNPIIFDAEAFEVVQGDTPEDRHLDHSHSHDHSHHHGHDGWSPEDGLERTGYTLVANFGVALGFSAIMLALMAFLVRLDHPSPGVLKSLIWGGMGFAVFFFAPALGLPPEIPGVEAPPVEGRQLWWLTTVVCVGAGALLLFFARKSNKIFAVPLFLIPYVMGAPEMPAEPFSHPNPEAVITLTNLHIDFVYASAVSNFCFWLVMGLASAWLLRTYVMKQPIGNL